MHIQTIVQDDAFAGARAGSHTGSRAGLWTGRVLSTLAAVSLLLDSIGKLMEIPPVVAGSAELGYPASTVFPIGVILLLCVVAYVIPSTSVLGAVLLTGYLGGAVATHVRVENPLLSHTLFPIYVGSLVWGGLFLREARVRALFPRRIRH
jgi:hypothetical protein